MKMILVFEFVVVKQFRINSVRLSRELDVANKQFWMLAETLVGSWLVVVVVIVVLEIADSFEINLEGKTFIGKLLILLAFNKPF